MNSEGSVVRVRLADQEPDILGYVENGEEVLSVRRGYLTPQEFVALASALGASYGREVLDRLA